MALVHVAAAALWAATVVLAATSAAAQPLEADRLAGATQLFTQYLGQHVRIAAQRFSELKRYTSPFSLLVGRREDGPWLILEETSESQP